MNSADERTDIDTWESSGLDLIKYQLGEGWNIDMWKSSGLDLIVPGGSQHTLHNTFEGAQTIDAELNPKLYEQVEDRINEVYKEVFNHMPIRLLKFDQHGKGITLVERSQLMQCISTMRTHKQSRTLVPSLGKVEDNLNDILLLRTTYVSLVLTAYSSSTGDEVRVNNVSQHASGSRLWTPLLLLSRGILWG